MEKQLMDKIRNHTTDDVDKAMITARLKVTQSELEDILNDLNAFLARLQNLCNNRKDEMALLGFRFILACDDTIIHKDDSSHDGVPCLCTFGSREEVRGLLDTLHKTIDS